MPTQKEGDPKEGLRLVIALSVIVGISLIGVLAINIIDTLDKTPFIMISTRIFVSALFLFSFAIMAFSIYRFTRLSRYFNDNRKVQALASLGLVIAIAQLGQFAVTGINFFEKQGATLPPEIIRHGIIHTLFFVGFVYLIYAIYIYKKI